MQATLANNEYQILLSSPVLASELMRIRSILFSLELMACTIALGLAIRFAPLGLPRFVVKYGGSMLWALTIYWVVSTLLPRLRFVPAALLAGTLATGIEFLKLYHAPALDAFRLTLPGILLFGRIFSAWDILSYWLAIAAGAFLDARLLRR
jgi:hypothetical protein